MKHVKYVLFYQNKVNVGTKTIVLILFVLTH